MARLVQLRNSVVLLLLLFVSCKEVNKKAKVQEVIPKYLSASDTSLSMANGIVLSSGQNFTGTIFSLFENEKDTAELRSYAQGKEDGIWKKFYPEGKKAEVRYFTNGEKIGAYLAWWPNGEKQLDYNFVNGEYEGECREWNEEGRLVKIMHYKAGHEEGTQQWWYDNGKIKANYIIKDGRRFGLLGTKNCVNVSDSIFND